MFRKAIILWSVIGMWLACSCDVFARNAAGAVYIKPTFSFMSTAINSTNPSEVYSPTIAAGLSGIFSEFLYLGGEVFWTPKSIPLHSQSNNMRISFQYGVSLLPGIVLDSSTIAYGRIGAITSMFSSLNEKKSAAELGLGVLYDWSSSWSLVGEYDYMRYQSFSGLGAPITNQFTVGLMLKFGL